MTPYNKIIDIDKENKTITVQSGATWTTVLDALSPLKLVPKIMQDKDLFTVGGSLSSNIMGRNPHDGPFIESVESFTLMDAEGNIHKASREENSELFSLAIGGYGLFGVILEVTLKVIPDAVVTLNKTSIPLKDYPTFVEETRNKPDVIFLVGMINTKFTEVMANVYTTSGQEVGSDSKEKTLGSLLRNKIARKYGEPWKSNNLIGCTFPLKNFAPFMQRMQSAIQETGSKINFISSKFIKKDSESVLALTKEDSIASNLMFDLTESTFKNIQELKPLLTQAAKELDRSIYLTFGHEIDKESMNILYPQLQYFLEKKLQFDPEERFSSQFYEKIK